MHGHLNINHSENIYITSRHAYFSLIVMNESIPAHLSSYLQVQQPVG
jgi:hypothetical protein